MKKVFLVPFLFLLLFSSSSLYAEMADRYQIIINNELKECSYFDSIYREKPDGWGLMNYEGSHGVNFSNVEKACNALGYTFNPISPESNLTKGGLIQKFANILAVFIIILITVGFVFVYYKIINLFLKEKNKRYVIFIFKIILLSILFSIFYIITYGMWERGFIYI